MPKMGVAFVNLIGEESTVKLNVHLVIMVKIVKKFADVPIIRHATLKLVNAFAPRVGLVKIAQNHVHVVFTELVARRNVLKLFMATKLVTTSLANTSVDLAMSE